MIIQRFGQMWADDRFVSMHQRPPEHSVFAVVMCALWFLVIVGVMVAVFKMMANHEHGTSHRDPLDIAKERFAKGEISKEELADIKKELKS